MSEIYINKQGPQEGAIPLGIAKRKCVAPENYEASLKAIKERCPAAGNYVYMTDGFVYKAGGMQSAGCGQAEYKARGVSMMPHNEALLKCLRKSSTKAAVKDIDGGAAVRAAFESAVKASIPSWFERNKENILYGLGSLLTIGLFGAGAIEGWRKIIRDWLNPKDPPAAPPVGPSAPKSTPVSRPDGGGRTALRTLLEPLEIAPYVVLAAEATRDAMYVAEGLEMAEIATGAGMLAAAGAVIAEKVSDLGSGLKKALKKAETPLVFISAALLYVATLGRVNPATVNAGMGTTSTTPRGGACPPGAINCGTPNAM